MSACIELETGTSAISTTRGIVNECQYKLHKQALLKFLRYYAEKKLPARALAGDKSLRI